MSKIKRIQLDVSGKGYKSQQDRFYELGGVMCSIPSTRTENKLNIIVPKTHQQDLVQDEKSISRSLVVGCHGNSKHFTKTKINGNIRRLTEIECERLQGFPDNWTEGISSTQRYKSLGNAVSVPIVKMIIERLYPSSTLKGQLSFCK